MLNKKKLFQIFGILILIIFFVFFIKNVDFNELYGQIQKISLPVMLLLLFLQVITQLLLAVQWHQISKNFIEDCTFLKMLFILTTGSVVEAITPGAKIGGEVARLYYLKKEFNCSTQTATHIIIIQKSISMSVLFGICLSAFWYVCENVKFFLPPASKMLISIVFVMLLLFFIVFLFFSGQIAKIIETKEGKITKKIYNITKSYSENIKTLTKKQWLIQFTISTFVWVLFPFKMLILVNSMNMHINPILIVSITMSAYMMAMLPITPGGLGTFEASLVALFNFLPISTEMSITIAVVFRFVTFWFVIIFSAVYVFFYKRRGIFAKK